MSAFLYLPSSRDFALARRVDLANIGALFAEVDEPSIVETRATVWMRRLAAALLIVLFALGDTVLVARPDCLSACLLGAAPSVVRATTT